MTRIRQWSLRDGATVAGLGPGMAGGLLAGLVLCPPVLAILLGLGGATLLALDETQQTGLRVVTGLLLALLVAWCVLWRRSRAGGKDRPLPFLLVSGFAFVATYVVLNYVGIPLFHALSHGLFAQR